MKLSNLLGARRLLVALLVVVAVARIVASWRGRPATLDEPLHLAAGMEWLDRGQYRYEPTHPPLARVAVAAGPYWDGTRSAGRPDPWDEGHALIDQRHDAGRTLALARLGILPFFVFTAILVFLWARSVANGATGLLAVLAFTSVPAVLAHSGLATTDAAMAAAVCATTVAMARWLERPSPWRTVWLGTAAGLALLTNFASLVFLPAAAAAVLLAWLSGKNPIAPYLGRAVAAGLVMLITLWGGYRFSVGPLCEDPAPAPAPPRGAPLAALARLPLFPAPEYFRGFDQLRTRSRPGPPSPGPGGNAGRRWDILPVAFGVRTPLPFLVLAGVGGVTLVGMGRRRPSALVPVLAPVALLVGAMAADLHLGVRHLLPVLPMLSVCAGLGSLRLWHWRRLGRTGPALAIALTGWLVVESALAHPDYLPYFNQLAAGRLDAAPVQADISGITFSGGRDDAAAAHRRRADQQPAPDAAVAREPDRERRGAR